MRWDEIALALFCLVIPLLGLAWLLVGWLRGQRRDEEKARPGVEWSARPRLTDSSTRASVASVLTQEQSSRTSVEQQSAELAQQLQQYQALRQEEEQLRARVHELERTAALYGELRRPADVSVQLANERETLEEMRERLARLEEEYEAQAGDGAPEVEAERLARLLSDIQAAQEQVAIHADNVRRLEELYSRDDARIDIYNELRETQARLEEVQEQLQELRHELRMHWGVEMDEIPELMEMSDGELYVFALTHVIQRAGGDEE